MKVKFFNPGLAYTVRREEYLDAIDTVLTRGDLILRKDLEQFETNLAAYIGVKHAIGLNSCTDALYLALRALKIGPGDEVLVPSRTFVASVQTIVQVGATPVFYDLDGALNITKKTKAVIPVHIEGAFDPHFDDIRTAAWKNDLFIIEDAAQALGATHNGLRAGSFGEAGCFSFYPAKTLGAFGDAGALVTESDEIADYVRECRNHFKTDARDWGVNSRLDNLQAAILNLKFNRLLETLRIRKEIAVQYTQGLMNLPITLPPHIPGRTWQDYIIRTKKRNELYEYLKERGVETLKNEYPFPVPKLPLAAAYEAETLRLPCNETITKPEVDYVIKNIIAFYEDTNHGE
jgi:dTDP-4-amino-4,6-dideoxygalactose transaminase